MSDDTTDRDCNSDIVTSSLSLHNESNGVRCGGSLESNATCETPGGDTCTDAISVNTNTMSESIPNSSTPCSE